MTNRETFLATYKKQLERSIQEQPEIYKLPLETLYQRMYHPLLAGTFNKDSPTVKRTCKELGIKHTYKAISEYLKKEM